MEFRRVLFHLFTALIHGFIAAVVPAGPFLFEGMLSGGEYDLPERS